MKLYYQIIKIIFWLSLAVFFFSGCSYFIDFFSTGSLGLIISSDRTGWLIFIGLVLLILASVNYLFFAFVKLIRRK